MANDDRRMRSRPVFRDEAERGGRALGGGPGTRYGGAVGRRSGSHTDYGSVYRDFAYTDYADPSGSFVGDYRGGPGSGGSLPARPRHGSGLGAFGFDEDARREAGAHRGRGPRNYVRSDERIREDLYDRLTDDPHLDASDIELEVTNGEVTLSGHVRNRADKRRAEDLAETVSGVRHVQNNVRIASAAEGADMAGTAGPSEGAQTRASDEGKPSSTAKRQSRGSAARERA